MKLINTIFDDQYAPPKRESNMPLNVQITGVTRPSPKYYADIVATNYDEGCYQFEYVMSGKGYIEIDGITTPITQGDFFFINKEVHRILYSDKEEPLKKIFFCGSGEFIDGIIKAYKMDMPLVLCKTDVYEHFQKIVRTAKKAPSFSPDILDQIGDEILKIVRQVYHKNMENTYTAKKNNPAESMMFYIQSNFTRKFSIEDMMQTFYMCKTQLIKQFKKHYGITPMKYVQIKRIEVSKHYLKDTDIPITRIHEMVGFSDAKYFSLAFKANTGMTPRDYRNSQRGTPNHTT